LNAFGRKASHEAAIRSEATATQSQEEKNESASRIERMSDEKKSESKHKRERI
jgi:hypothetical protein